jgi:hypothetical protein
LPAAQSVSSVQLVRQAVAPQAYGEQVRTTGAGQAAEDPVHLAACVSLPPLHDAATQTVPALPAVKVQPLPAAQPSTVQTLPSEHGRAAPPVQTPLWQVSAVVQALPSLHVVPFPFAGLVQAPLTHEPWV